jgi:hypothetical protein
MGCSSRSKSRTSGDAMEPHIGSLVRKILVGDQK